MTGAWVNTWRRLHDSNSVCRKTTQLRRLAVTSISIFISGR